MRDSGDEARAWIASHPGSFARLTAERFAYFWLGPLDRPGIAVLFSLLTGLALLGALEGFRRLTPPQFAALVIPLLTFPLVYYLVPWQHRYRFPVEWVLFLLAGSAVVGLFSRAGGSARTRAPEVPARERPDLDSGSP
jgi:hypothetical protein